MIKKRKERRGKRKTERRMVTKKMRRGREEKEGERTSKKGGRGRTRKIEVKSRLEARKDRRGRKKNE